MNKMSMKSKFALFCMSIVSALMLFGMVVNPPQPTPTAPPAPSEQTSRQKALQLADDLSIFQHSCREMEEQPLLMFPLLSILKAIDQEYGLDGGKSAAEMRKHAAELFAVKPDAAWCARMRNVIIAINKKSH